MTPTTTRATSKATYTRGTRHLRSQLLDAVAIILSVLLARVFTFNQPITGVDEAFYLLTGDRLLHGAVLYVDIWDRKPPGLFLIYSAIRLLHGSGILQYQLVAACFVAATAWVIRAIGLSYSNRLGATLAGVAYAWWTALCGGAGGQSPVFYNLFMALAGLLVVRSCSVQLTPSALLLRGSLAMLAVGAAIFIKTSAVIEGLFIGMFWVWLAYSTVGGVRALGFATVWSSLTALPAALAAAWFASIGHFGEFAYATVVSIRYRDNLDFAEALYRFGISVVMVLPLYAIAVAGCSVVARGKAGCYPSPRRLLLAWLGISVLAVWLGSMGAIFEHYLLPTLVPATAASALGFAEWRRRKLQLVITAAALVVATWAITFSDRLATSGWTTVRKAAELTRGQRNCPFVFEGSPSLIHLNGWCAPTVWLFPTHLSYGPERHALGVDVLHEVDRILQTRPDRVILRREPPTSANLAARTHVLSVLARDYELRGSIEPDGLNVYALRQGRLPAPNDIRFTPHITPATWP